MPELPEVETVRGGLERVLRGRQVTSVELFRADLRWPIPAGPMRRLVGRRLRDVARRSKYLLLRFAGRDPATLLVHLGMTGRLFVADVRRRAHPPRLPHEHWRLGFGGRLLRYVDARRFGMLDVVDGREADHRLLCRLGPEPFDAAFDGAALHARTRSRRTPIKSFLMDARNVVGVGNIYAAEALFRAGVRPTRTARRLDRRACDALAAAVRSTLAEAVRAGGTTIRDYVGVDEDAGRFQQRLAVYGRAGEPCRTCAATIRRVLLAGRATFYCPRCQR